MPGSRRRTPLSARTVAAAMLVLGAAIATVAAFLYFRFVRYERVALAHAPSGAALVARLDVEQGVFYAPARRHLLPLLGAPDETGAERLFQDVESAAGLKRGDLRELVLAAGPQPGDWVLVLGGLFPEEAMGGLARALAPRGFAPAGADGRVLVQGTTGVAVGQARDRSLLVASSEALARRALPGSAVPEAPLSEGLAAFVVRGPLLPVLAALAPGLPPLEAVRGTVDYADRARVRVSFEPVAVSAPAAEGTLAVLRSLDRDGPVTGVLRGAADRARVTGVAGGGHPALELVWEREELDRAFAALAVAIRNAFRGVSGPAVLTRP